MENKEVTQEQEVRQLSYEELKNTAAQLNYQLQQAQQKNQQLIVLLEQANTDNIIKRLSWLWQTIESDNKYITEEFKQDCAKEFMEMMAKPEEQPVEK